MDWTQKLFNGMKGLANDIMSPISAIWDWLVKYKNWRIEVFNEYYDYLADLFASVRGDVSEWGLNLLNIAYNWAIEIIQPKIQIALDFVQTEMSWLFNMVKVSNEFFYTADYFLPLHEFFIGLTGLLTLWALCLIIKVVVKIIPTIY